MIKITNTVNSFKANMNYNQNILILLSFIDLVLYNWLKTQRKVENLSYWKLTKSENLVNPWKASFQHF